jgi:hypothetical protein
MLQTQGLKTLDDVRGFLAGNQAVAIHTPNREAAYAFIAQSLSRLTYRRLGKADKGLMRAYLATALRGGRSRFVAIRPRQTDCGRLPFDERPPQSQLSAPPVWYSVTRVSKKFFSFFRSSTSDIQGKGLVAPAYCSGRPIWEQRRLAMN